MKNKKLLILLSGICLVLVSAALPLVAACAKPSPTPTPAPAPTPTPTPTSVKPIKLRLSHQDPPMAATHKDIHVPWVEKIEERTTAIGKPVEITIYPAQALCKAPDQYDCVAKGIADIAHHLIGITPGRFPLSLVTDLPFLFPSATVASQVYQELFDTWPEIRDEFAETKVLWFMPTPPSQILARTKQIKTLEDLEGLRVWAHSGIGASALEAMGAVPIFMSITEVYIALERGLLDVAPREWEGAFAFKFFEVTKYRTVLPQGFSIAPLIVFMNWDTWNSLPPDVQEIFEELTGPNMSRSAGQTFDGANMHLFGSIKEYDKKVGNPEIYMLPEDEFQRWKEAVAPVYEEWEADMEAKGLPGQAVFEDVQRLIEKYSK